MTIPYREHRFSPHDCEFVLATRKFYPQASYVLIVALAIGIITLVGSWERGLQLWMSAGIAVGIAMASLGAIPLLFLWRTGQLAVENYLLGNIRGVMGHVNWPPIRQNVLAEQAVTFDWAEIRDVVLRPAPWAFAPNNLALELNFHDGRQRIMRVPNLAQNEVEGFVKVLELIALRRGFHFHEGHPHPLHPTLHL